MNKSLAELLSTLEPDELLSVQYDIKTQGLRVSLVSFIYDLDVEITRVLSNIEFLQYRGDLLYDTIYQMMNELRAGK
jgi:hypothetical protein